MRYSDENVLENFTIRKPPCESVYELNYIVRSLNYGRPFHVHDFWQYFLVVEGTVVIVSNDNEYILTRGQANLIPPFQKHMLYSDGGYTQVGINFYDDPTLDQIGLFQLLRLYAKATLVAQDFRTLEHSPELKQYISNGSTIDCVRASLILYEGVLNLVESFAYSNHERFDIRLSRYLEKKIGESLTTEQIAEHFHMSISQLERLSKKYFGSGVISVYNSKRLNRAIALLLGTDQSISNIAQQIGFFDLSHFSSFFSKRMGGISPSQYRKEREYKS